MGGMKTRTLVGLGIGLAGLLVPGAVSLAKRHRDITELVPADLRSPMLYLSLPTTSRAGLRLTRAAISRITFPIAAGVRTRDETARVEGREPVGVRLYEPANRQAPTGVLYWIHGGGFILGMHSSGNPFCSRVADELGVLVVSVDYRVAPEYPFPTPLEDCYTGLRWVHDNADELGVAPDRIAIGGDSAGGGLSACLAQLALDRGEVAIALQLLVYPMLDDRTCLRTDLGNLGRVGWDPASNRFGWTSYLGHPPREGLTQEYAVAARRDDLSGLPPAWIGVGSIDLFHDEDLEYARRLREAGVEVEVQVVEGMPHGADGFGTAPSIVSFGDSKLAALRRALCS